MTLARKAYDNLRRDIVRGAFAPESPLRLAELGERYGMGFSPLREALNRLDGERLVTSESLRGFRVAPLSLAQFEDALASRKLVETEALTGAIARGGDDWAAGVVAALYGLKLQAGRASARPDTIRPDTDRPASARDNVAQLDSLQRDIGLAGAPDDEAALWELEARHHAFHRILLSGCGSAWLMEFFERLYAAMERYRLPVLLASHSLHQRDIQAEHTELAEAALARDTERAVALLHQHYQRTAEMIRGALLAADA